MDNEEYVRAQQVIAESTSTLVVSALQESVEELRGEIEFLKEEIARLRRSNRALRTVNRQVRGKTTDLMKQVEEMGQHIMDIAVQETAEDSDSTPDDAITT